MTLASQKELIVDVGGIVIYHSSRMTAILNPFMRKPAFAYAKTKAQISWFRGRVVCALDYEAGDPGSGGTTDWLFSARW